MLRVAAAISTLYGLSDETHQVFVPQRCASAFDFMADSIGNFTGAWAALHAKRLKDSLKKLKKSLKIISDSYNIRRSFEIRV